MNVGPHADALGLGRVVDVGAVVADPDRRPLVEAVAGAVTGVADQPKDAQQERAALLVLVAHIDQLHAVRLDALGGRLRAD